MAHSYVRIVAADKYLSALGNDVAALVNSRVDYRLLTARADGFYLAYGVGNLKQTVAALKGVSQKIRPQAEAQNGHVQLVYDAAKLVDLGASEELTFVGNYNVVIVHLFELVENIGVGGDGARLLRKSDARAYAVRTVAVVK